MNERQVEELLWELSQEDSDPAGTSPAEELLSRYAAGELSVDEARKVELVLENSARARHRLAKLADVEQEAAVLGRVRARVLAESVVGPSKRARFGVGGSRDWIRVAAMLVVFALAALSFRTLRAPDSGHPLATMEFDVRVQGVAEVRSDLVTMAGEPVEVYPDTQVEITIEAQQSTTVALAFGVYRLDQGLLRRLTPADGLHTELYRGAAALRAKASQLVGYVDDETWSGPRTVYLVVAEEGDLPLDQRIGSADSVESALRGPARKVLEQTLLLLKPTQPSAKRLLPQ